MRCCAQAQNPADLSSKRIHSDKFNAYLRPQMIRYILMHWLSKRLLICVYVWRGMFENPDKWDQWGWLSPWAGSQSRLCDTQIQVPEANIPKTFDKYSKFRFSVFEQIDSKPFAHSAFEHFLQRNIVDGKAWYAALSKRNFAVFDWSELWITFVFLMFGLDLQLARFASLKWIVNYFCFCFWLVLICIHKV